MSSTAILAQSGVSLVSGNSVYGGYLLKRARIRNNNTSKTWSLRYITIDNRAGILKYYGDFRDIQKNILPKGSLYLVGASISFLEPQEEKQFCFEILITKTTGDVESLIFNALNEVQMEAWLDILRKVDSFQFPVVITTRRASLSVISLSRENMTDMAHVFSLGSNEMGGYLYKQGRGKHNSLSKPWTNRFITLNLQTCILRYYTDGEIYKREGVLSAKGHANLQGSSIYEVSRATYGKDFAFQIALTSAAGVEETLVFSADSKVLLNEWVKLCRDAAAVAPPQTAVENVLDTFGGYLMKQSRGKKSAARTWKTRYITIDIASGILQYFKEFLDVQRGRMPMGAIYLVGGAVANAPPRDDKQYCFEITITKTTGEVESLLFNADNEEQRIGWINILRKVENFYMPDNISEAYSVIESSKPVASNRVGWQSLADDERVSYLHKQGRGRNITSKLLYSKPWSLRFVTVNIRTGILRYYANGSDYETYGVTSAKGAANLKGAYISEVSSQSCGRDLAFQATLENSNGRQENLIFSADNLKHLEDWLQIFRDASGLVLGPFDTTEVNAPSNPVLEELSTRVQSLRHESVVPKPPSTSPFPPATFSDDTNILPTPPKSFPAPTVPTTEYVMPTPPKSEPPNTQYYSISSDTSSLFSPSESPSIKSFRPSPPKSAPPPDVAYDTGR